jgi:hypothetical protein
MINPILTVIFDRYMWQICKILNLFSVMSSNQKNDDECINFYLYFYKFKKLKNNQFVCIY